MSVRTCIHIFTKRRCAPLAEADAEATDKRRKELDPQAQLLPDALLYHQRVALDPGRQLPGVGDVEPANVLAEDGLLVGVVCVRMIGGRAPDVVVVDGDH